MDASGILSLEKSKTIFDPYKLVWLIIGPSGVGKTTFCSTIPDAYFMMTDVRGADCVSVYGGDRPIETWDQFKDVAREFILGSHPFKNLIIDDMPSAWELCATDLCRKRGKDTLQDVASKGGGFKQCEVLFKRVMMPIFASGYGIFMTCTETRESYESSTTGQSDFKIWPDIIATARRIIVGKAHQMGRIYTKKMNEGGKMVEKRVISFRQNDLFESKDRSGLLEPHGDIFIDNVFWDAVVRHFPAEVDTETTSDAKETENANGRTDAQGTGSVSGDV